MPRSKGKLDPFLEHLQVLTLTSNAPEQPRWSKLDPSLGHLQVLTLVSYAPEHPPLEGCWHRVGKSMLCRLYRMPFAVR